MRQILPGDNGFPVCLGRSRSIARCEKNRRITCILCQETSDLAANAQAVVCVAYMQKSALFAGRKKEEVGEGSISEVFLPASLRSGPGASTCGHTMHFDCYRKFTELLKDHERSRNRQLMTYNPRVVNVNFGEYLCPLCKRLSNAVLPVLPAFGPDILERLFASYFCL
ncbi:unnamed protein product [Gongylonema pulchrum]|uniref:E3 ubiquitin-protein ligase n=1 Tax=Gongylonema pulchrum TaxID=637853 RepID=A0A183EMQ9_9BILA|nr:unnamed protein product [Gongylonema pulchrum]